MTTAPRFPVVLRHLLTLAPDEAYPVAPPIGAPSVVLPVRTDNTEALMRTEDLVLRLDEDSPDLLTLLLVVTTIEWHQSGGDPVSQEEVISSGLSIVDALMALTQYVGLSALA